MITEIKRKDLDTTMAIFPDIRIDVLENIDEDAQENKTIYLETIVQIDNYLNHIIKKYEYTDKINYVLLMQFIDSLQSDVTRLKKNFNPKIYEGNKVLGIYKIIK